ncbi:MAG: CPBP family intramembrane glutamic endopeptidase [Vulcanimicrobiaceae bacterium]
MFRRSVARPQAEQYFLDFITSTRLGVVLVGCCVAFILTFVGLAAGDGFLLRYGFKFPLTYQEGGAIAYNIGFGLPLVALVCWKRHEFKRMFFGDLDTRRVLFLGLVPALTLFLLPAGLIISLSYSFHTPLRDYIQKVVYTPSLLLLAMLPIGPFVEEMIFRVWLQTRLQQYLGGLAGAILTGIVFFGYHLSTDLSLISGVVLFSWLRLRYRSLGTTLIAHYTLDLLVFLFGVWASWPTR